MQNNFHLTPTVLSLSRKTAADGERSQALCEYLRQKLQDSSGRMAFADFMQDVLYHPTLGYYQAPTLCLGIKGDFITAPEISPLFAQAFATQCQELFQQMNPEARSILEMGAGSGRFACDLLLMLDQLHCLPQDYWIVDPSKVLVQRQRAHLKATLPATSYARCRWTNTLPKRFSGIVIANEVLDALAVHRFRIGDDGIEESNVVQQDAGFAQQFALSPHPPLCEAVQRLGERYGLPSGYQSEWHGPLVDVVRQVTQMLQFGMIFWVDYGYGEREYYHPERSRGTLTCFYQHHRHTDPLILVGLQDITAHVNFTQVMQTALQYGGHLAGFTTQAAFLLANDFITHVTQAEKGLSSADVFNLRQGIKILTFPIEMGEYIKVMGIDKGMPLSCQGLSASNHTHTL